MEYDQPKDATNPERNGERDFEEASMPGGGYAHEWNWEEELGVPVHVDRDEGIAWVRISECPPEQQQPLWEWVRKSWMSCPIIDGIEPQDAIYVWDYAAFVDGHTGSGSY